MPYSNIDPSDTATIQKMDACKEKVMATGKDEKSAIAICYASVVEGKDLDEVMRTFKLDAPATAAEPVTEAATIKNQVRALIRMVDEILDNRDVPPELRESIKGIRETFKTKAWAELASDSAGTRECFAESYGGVEIVEAAVDTSPARQPLTMRVQLIRPGWGNSKDNHYYPAEVLKRDAKVFEGVKMYTTNHDPKEKSVRTEVSQIKRIAGFTDEGAPIAEVNVFDPSFAEQVRNRAKSGALDSLECSVLGEGTSKPFTLDGRSGKLIESITNADSVDWVTRAGAGGKALGIAESEPTNEPEGATMTDPKNEAEKLPPIADKPAPVAEAVIPPAPAEPTRLSELEVTALLEAEKRLPIASRVHLAEGQYTNAEAVKAATVKELAYLSDILGSGQPFAMGATQPAQKSPEQRIAEANARMDRVNDKWLHGGK
jgi:hypothetical protein